MAADFDLLPADDDELTPEADLDAAAASALADPDAPAEVEVEPPIPFGRTAAFDFDRGRFIRQGGAPAYVSGFEALKQWCLMAVNSARYAHAVFTEEFGMEQPNAALGTVGPEAVEAADDAMQAIREAWLVHDRIAEVQGSAVYDPIEGVIFVEDLYVVTDEEVELSFPDLRLTVTTEA